MNEQTRLAMVVPPTDDGHPVSADVRRRVLGELARIEREHEVRVLFACESGSRGWGFASLDSDYDVRFIYVHRPEWYLRVMSPRDVIECPIADDLDVSGWELRKTLRLVRGGNTAPAEWLDSPIVYRADADIAPEIRVAIDAVFRPERAFHHYLHMARGNYRGSLQGETVRLKKYFYVLRPVLAAEWIARGLGRPPMRFEALLEVLVPAGDLRAAIDELLRVKRDALEVERGPRVDVINAFIEVQFERLAQHAPQPASGIDPSVLDRLLHRVVLGA